MSIFDDYANSDLWSEKELVALCCGVTPQGSFVEKRSELNKASEAISRAIIAKILPCIISTDTTAGDRMYGHARFFYPAEAAKWAMPRFPDFPKELQRLVPFWDGLHLARMRTTIFDDYAPLDLWRDRELVSLCCGIDPEGFFEDKMNELNEARETIDRAVLVKKLSRIEPMGATGLNKYFYPAEATKWAMPRFHDFPKELHGLANSNSDEFRQNANEMQTELESRKTSIRIPSEQPAKEQPIDEYSKMLKLIFVMAVDHYDYKPGKSRNDATGGNSCGISNKIIPYIKENIEPDTIRNCLKAAEVLLNLLKRKTKNTRREKMLMLIFGMSMDGYNRNPITSDRTGGKETTASIQKAVKRVEDSFSIETNIDANFIEEILTEAKQALSSKAQ